MASIIGTDGNDRRVGTAAADFMNLKQGDDTGQGLGGSDLLRGGAGSDRLYGGGGNDLVRGDNGNDRLEGGHGGDGRDRLEGGLGSNDLTGGDGLDRFVLTATDDLTLGLTVRQFDRALDDPIEGEQLLISAIAAGGADVIHDAEDGEHMILDAGFRVQDIFFTVFGGPDGDGDGQDGDIFGVVGFYGAHGAASLKLLLLPDQFRDVELHDIVETATGVDVDFLALA